MTRVSRRKRRTPEPQTMSLEEFIAKLQAQREALWEREGYSEFAIEQELRADRKWLRNHMLDSLLTPTKDAP